MSKTFVDFKAKLGKTKLTQLSTCLMSNNLLNIQGDMAVMCQIISRLENYALVSLCWTQHCRAPIDQLRLNMTRAVLMIFTL